MYETVAGNLKSLEAIITIYLGKDELIDKSIDLTFWIFFML